MKSLNITALLFTLAAFLLVSLSSGFAQEGSLEAQFEELKKKSNNYQIYKVVKKTDLEEFWKSIDDTLGVNENTISNLRNEVKGLKNEVGSLKNQVAERDSSLSDQSYMIEHMDFLGVSVGKSSYKTITWVIIFALLAILIVLYIRFTGANRVTKSTRKEFSKLQEEFETHRQKARETETKLKRDLQTEINKVEEMKEKFGKG